MSFITQTNSGNTIQIGAEQDGAFNNALTSGEDVIIGGIGNEFTLTTSSSSLQVSVDSGQGVINGRTIRSDSANTITLSASTTSYLVLRIDLTQTYGNEGMLYALPSLSSMQSDNLNSGGSIHDMLIATITTDSSGVSNVVDNRNIVQTLKGRSTSISIAVADWGTSTYGFSCIKTLTGVKASDKVHFSVEVDMTSADYQNMINARAYIQDVLSSTDTITIYAVSKPTVDITLDVWGY